MVKFVSLWRDFYSPASVMRSEKNSKQGYSLIIVVLIAAIAVYYEGRIIHILEAEQQKIERHLQ